MGNKGPRWHPSGVLPTILGINTYTAATILGYAIGVVGAFYLGRRDGRPWRDMIELGVVVVISAVLGAKVFHTLFEAKGHRLPDGSVAQSLWDLLAVDPWHWARLFEAGYVFYGGAVFGTFFAWLWAVRTRQQDKGAYGDYAAPFFALAYGVGRAGCFAAGCCYGVPTELPWSVQYPLGHESHPHLIHPVQLYDAFFGCAMFVVLWVLFKRRSFPGQTFAIFVLSYAVWRFTTEMFRGDADRGVWLGDLLSTSQLVSLCVIPVTIFFTWRAYRASQVASSAVEDE